MTRHETITLSPATMPESPPITWVSDEDIQTAETSFESRNSDQEDLPFALYLGSVPREASCLDYYRYSLSELAGDLLTFYPIYITFFFFWVQGMAYPLEHPFFRLSNGDYAKYAYGAAMTIFTVSILQFLVFWKKVAEANRTTRWELTRFLTFDMPAHWELIRFVVIGLHIAAPFVVSSIILHAEYDQACNGYAFTLASSRGGALESGSHTLGTYYMTSEQNSTLRLGFNVSQGDSIDDNVSVNHNTSYELVFNGSGDGHLRMDCDDVPRCITGELHLRRDSLEGEIQYLGGKPKTFKLSTVFWLNPMAISIDGQYALETAKVPTTDEVKICANDLRVGIIGGSFVSLLQEHVESCRQCIWRCYNDCSSVRRRLVSSGNVGDWARSSADMIAPEMAQRRLYSETECSGRGCHKQCPTNCTGVASP
jgi:hypothetical protein